MFCDFKTTTHGKWILAGEHSVIRGGTALVYPIPQKSLSLNYAPSTADLTADYVGETGSELHLLFWSVMEHGMHLLGKSLNTLSGHFILESTIPIGVGMGASAALSVAVARWFSAQTLIKAHDIQSFSTQLEHLFHGKSSGLDIAGVSSSVGVQFKQGNALPIQQRWQPHWYLSSSGQIGITSHCINQVQTLWDNNADLGRAIDQQMEQSVQLAITALANDSIKARTQLAEAISLAEHCFQQWGLISESLQLHMLTLKNAGAIAVKPTGSGSGGFVVSLWENASPPKDLGLISMSKDEKNDGDSA